MNAKEKDAEIARLRRELEAERAAHAETRKMLGDALLRPVTPFPMPVYVPPVISPRTDPPCAFDNLPPGVYGLVCTCPKCTPQYGSITVASSFAGLSSPTYLAPNSPEPGEPICIPTCSTH